MNSETETDPAANDAATMLCNRLRKNLRVLGKWARQQNIECYRLYDRDLPEYAFAIDIYGKRVQMAEYQAPASIDETKVAARREQAMAAVQEVLGIEPEHIVLKSRERQRGKQQYEAQDQTHSFFTVDEGPASFWINLEDYLDTGIIPGSSPDSSVHSRECLGENASSISSATPQLPAYKPR